MLLKGLLVLIGSLILRPADVQAQCSDGLKAEVEPIVESLLGALTSVNGITMSCDDSIKADINCTGVVQPKMDDLNAITNITGLCLIYAIEYYDDTAETNQFLINACSFSDLQDHCTNLTLNYAVNGSYGAWSEWSECMSSSMSRNRSCDSPSPSNDGYDCTGDAEETEECESTTTDDSNSHGTTLQINKMFYIWSIMLAIPLIWGYFLGSTP